MLGWIDGLLQWNRRRRQWNAEHIAAWAGYDVPGESGLTPFQVRCEALLTEELTRRGVRLAARCLDDTLGGHVRAQLGHSGWSIAIYRDGAQLNGPEAVVVVEQWDARTPNDLITIFLGHVDRVLNGVSGSGEGKAPRTRRPAPEENDRAVPRS